LKIFFQS